MNLRNWKAAAVIGGLTLAAAGGGIAAATVGGSTPSQQVRLVPSDVSGSTTTVGDTTTVAPTTTVPAPATTVPVPTAVPRTTTTVALQSPLTVPDVVGMSYDQATTTLRAAGFPSTWTIGDHCGTGPMISQKPTAGSNVERGTVVFLTCSS